MTSEAMVNRIKENLQLKTEDHDLQIVDTVMLICDYCYPAFYLVLNHATFKQIKKRHNINYSDGFYIGLLYAVPLVLS